MHGVERKCFEKWHSRHSRLFPVRTFYHSDTNDNLSEISQDSNRLCIISWNKVYTGLASWQCPSYHCDMTRTHAFIQWQYSFNLRAALSLAQRLAAGLYRLARLDRELQCCALINDLFAEAITGCVCSISTWSIRSILQNRFRVSYFSSTIDKNFKHFVYNVTGTFWLR